MSGIDRLGAKDNTIRSPDLNPDSLFAAFVIDPSIEAHHR